MPEKPPSSRDRPSIPLFAQAAGKQARSRLRLANEPAYAELLCASNFSFLRGASHPEELAATASVLGLAGFAIADRNTLAGIVRGHLAAKTTGARYAVGCRLAFRDGTPDIAVWPTDRVAYGTATPPAWLLGAAALLGAGAHFANALPDLADDAATGVRGLPHRIGRRASTAVAGALLVAAVVTVVLGPPGPPAGWGVAALGVAVTVLPLGWYADRAAAARGRRPTALFRAFLVVAVLTVALLLAGGARG